MFNKKVVAIIQARMKSTRLPGKVLLPMCGKPALQWCVERVRRARSVDQVVVATPAFPTSDASLIGSFCRDELKCSVWYGEEEDVLKRVHDAAVHFKAKYVVDITADCPFVDPFHIDEIVKRVIKNGYQYGSNIWPRAWPDGLDVQVYPMYMLKDINELEKDPIKRSHVGWNIQNRWLSLAFFSKKNVFTKFQWEPSENFSHLECTLDTKKDLMLMNKMLEHFYARGIEDTFTAMDVIRWLLDHPQKKQKRKIPGEG